MTRTNAVLFFLGQFSILTLFGCSRDVNRPLHPHQYADVDVYAPQTSKKYWSQLIDASQKSANAFFQANIAFPVYELSNLPIVIDETVGASCTPDTLFTNGAGLENDEPAQAPGRHSRVISPQQRASLLKYSRLTLPARPIQVDSAGYFNLWRIHDLKYEDGFSVVVLGFAIKSANERDLFLGIGADFALAVAVNGEIVYARSGCRIFFDSAEVVAARLNPGINQVAIICQRGASPGEGNFTPEWLAKIRVSSSLESLAQVHYVNNPHPFDTPIVSKYTELRTTGVPPLYQEASLFNLGGDLLLKGNIKDDTTIEWEQLKTPLPDIVIGSVNGLGAEPLMIHPVDKIDELAHGLVNDEIDPVRGAWAYRVNHLLKEENRGFRSTLDWNQKFVLACYNILPRSSSQATNLIQDDPKVGSYFSKRDGSTQYYLYSPAKSQANALTEKERIPSRLIVVVPGVSDPVRPFLESGYFAGYLESLYWISAAKEYGFTILWPGVNNIDCGGELTQASLDEVLGDFIHDHPGLSDEIYLYGICSGAVAATRFAANTQFHIEGLMLHSPELLRQAGRYTPNIPSDNYASPRIHEDLSSLNGLYGRLRDTRIAVLFDSAIPGHGDLDSTRKFVHECQNRGIEAEWIDADMDQDWIWGIRMKHRLSLFLRWAKLGNPKPHGIIAKVQIEPAVTVRRLLAKGFWFDGDIDGNFWVTGWQESYRLWRGSGIPQTPPFASATRVSFRRFKNSDEIFLSQLNAGHLARALARGNEIFGVALREEAGRPGVIVFSNANAATKLPQVDPVIDGDFRGAIWCFVSGTWEPCDVW